MSTGELRRYLELHKPKRIIFSTENQDWYDIIDPCKTELVFTIMLISDSPNIITMRNGSQGVMCLDRVKYIEVDEKISVLGTVLRVWCGDRDSCKNDRSYTLIAA